MSQITIPNVFTSGTVIDPTAVNANFAAIAAYLNGANIGTGQIEAGASTAPSAHATTHNGGGSDDIGASFVQLTTGAVPAGRVVLRAMGRIDMAASAVDYVTGGLAFVSKPAVGVIIVNFTNYDSARRYVPSVLADLGVGADVARVHSCARAPTGLRLRSATTAGVLNDDTIWLAVWEITA